MTSVSDVALRRGRAHDLYRPADAPLRPGRQDQVLARRLHQQGVPLSLVSSPKIQLLSGAFGGEGPRNLPPSRPSAPCGR